MDIKAEIEKVVGQISNDGDLKEKFSKDPSGTVKGLLGDKVDKDTLAKIVETVKGLIGKVDLSKVDLGSLGEKISGVFGGKLPDAVTGLLGGGKKDDEKKDEDKKD